jgi:hypothetical protein
MTTLTKAAKDAAKEITKAVADAAEICGVKLNWAKQGSCEKSFQELLEKHLAPVQAELDRLNKEMGEARQWIQDATQSCGCEDSNGGNLCMTCTDQQDWLERNK